MSGIIDAENKEVDPKNLTSLLKHIHLGVFFDGTSNNMVRQAMYSTPLLNVSIFGLGQKRVNHGSSEKDGSSKRIDDLRGKMHRQKLKIVALEMANSYNPNYSTELLIAEEKRKLQFLQEEIETASSTYDVSDKDLYDDASKTGKGYSNIAILYSLFNEPSLVEQFQQTENQKMVSEPYKVHKIYIEGSGAEDMVAISKSNINGLGFGLGLTGVTALVSKAIKRVTEFINSLGSAIDANTKLHLYVYGFSRGATCARVFSHILTRAKGSTLPSTREKEFTAFLKENYFENNRLSFLEKKCAHKTELTCKNITIEILGIYDTVASIGFLKQKDGWSDSMRNMGLYSVMPNYKDNWHYRNVFDYGLYLENIASRPMVNHVFHIGALDEYRENFAFTDIGEKVPPNAVEVMIPGCHSDVGGGYMTGLDQESELSMTAEKIVVFQGKKSTSQLKTCVSIHNYQGGKPRILKIIDNSPKLYAVGSEKESEIADPALLNSKSLVCLGWLEKFRDEKGKIAKKKSDRKTYSMAEHDKKVIYFKRFVYRGWSDVSLEMMIKYCTKMGFPVFGPNKIYNYLENLNSNDNVLNLAKNLVNSIQSYEEGKRYWVTIADDISSEKYRELRLNYIHFTSSSSILHSKNPFRNKELNAPLGGSLANFGNKPNFDLNGVLCRINYHGDKRNYSGENEYVEAVCYLDEMYEHAEKIDISN